MRNCLFIPLTSLTILGGVLVGVMVEVFVGLVVALIGTALDDKLVALCAGFELGVVGTVIHSGSWTNNNYLLNVIGRTG